MTEAPLKRHWLAVASLAGLVLGLVIVAIGLAWPKIVTPQMVWSPEQAEELQRAADSFHAAREQNRPVEGQASGQEGAAALSPRALAEQRYNRLKNDLEAAQSVRTDWGQWVVAAGFGLTIAGGMGYLAVRGD